MLRSIFRPHGLAEAVEGALARVWWQGFAVGALATLCVVLLCCLLRGDADEPKQ